jgi:Uma2 family endonuclease
MLQAQPRPLTVHDYRQLPEGPPYYQLIEGNLYMAPSPDRLHQDILGNLYHILRNHLEKRPSGSVHLAPSDVQLTDLNVYQPDLYYVAKTRKTILTKQGACGAPNLVVEILSPKTAQLDSGVKREIYARSGVEEMWIVDPAVKKISVYRFDEAIDTPVGTYGVRQKFESPLFPGLKIELSRVFAP